MILTQIGHWISTLLRFGFEQIATLVVEFPHV